MISPRENPRVTSASRHQIHVNQGTLVFGCQSKFQLAWFIQTSKAHLAASPPPPRRPSKSRTRLPPQPMPA
ncbi:hypothetical protein KC322_g99 [Hortaea werneckii]|nr:hypothetical protein KC322_g99 [Hortaea werneckii]